MRTRPSLHLGLIALLFLPAAVGAQRADDRQREAQREAQRRERERERDRARRDKDAEKASRKAYDDDDDDERGSRRARIDTTVAFDRRGEVSLSISSGQIVVRGWDRAQARVRAESDDGTLRFDHSPSRLTLRDERHGSDDTRYELTIPYGTRLVMRSNSGDLTATDVRGEVEARTTSGDVRIEGTSGRTIFESVSGGIVARNLSGPVRGNAVSGDVQLDGVVGDVEVGTVSGELTLNRARSTYVRLESTSGDLTFSGPLDRSGRYGFNSHSGTITLAVPPDAGAQMSVETFSGELDTDFPITLGPDAGRDRPRRFEFTLGSGGARVTTESFSGDIVLRRSAAGSSSSPRN
jgi:DUF4097 and DUF4098 domain-containing protein YvlB